MPPRRLRLDFVRNVNKNIGMTRDVEPCTMKTLAEHLGISVMTVSRALRNAPNVAEKTRALINKEAERLNFQPDPALGVLNAYRHGRRIRKTREQIAFVTNFPHPTAWKQVVTFARYFEGACRRAEQLGYKVEPFWLGDPSFTPRRVSQILRDRGIRGILVGPLAKGNSSLSLEWDWFSTVAVGRSLASPAITTVSTNHFQSLGLAWTEVAARGFQRIGFAVTEHEEARTQGALRAAFLLCQARYSGPKLPIFLTSDFSASGISEWATQHKPDVILSSEQNHHDLLSAKQRAAIGFVHLNIDPAAKSAGIDQGHDQVGEHAAALLHLKLLQRQRGILDRREILMVDGTWHEGAIVKTASTAAVPRTRART